jgi:hypothetical protein
MVKKLTTTVVVFTMRTGWSDELAQPILRVKHTRKVSQALRPALVKIARLWRIDATRTVRDIMDTLDQLEPMSEEERSMHRRLNP